MHSNPWALALAAFWALLPAFGPGARPVRAQEAPPPSPASMFHGEARLSGLAALSADRSREASVGFNIGVGAGWRAIPALVGFDLSATYGPSRSFQTSVEADGRELPLTGRRDSKYFLMQVWLRVQPPPSWWLRPYVEGIAGGARRSAEYTLSFISSDTATTTSYRDWSRSVGWGVGLDVRLAGDARALSLTLGFRRLYGPTALSSSLKTEMPGVEATVAAATGLYVYSLGLCGRFDFGEPTAPQH